MAKKLTEEERAQGLRDAVQNVLQVAQARRYRPLPRDASLGIRAIYEANLPRILTEGDSLSFFTPLGTLLATGYNRVVIGDHGAYVEFLLEHLVVDTLRLKHGKPTEKAVKYLWWEPVDGSGVKVYEQRDTVAYADYKIGMWYIDPHAVIIV